MLTETDIVSLLKNVQPQPGAHLRARVANATWNAPEQRAASGRGRLPWGSVGISMRRLVWAALGVAGVLLVFFTIPSFTGIAQRVANFFYRLDEDTLSIRLTPSVFPLPVGGTEEGGTSQPFPLTLAEAAAQAGFPVQAPHWLPEGFQFYGAEYEPERQTVVLDYYSPIPGKFLRLTQSQTAENLIHISNIGASAEVHTVEIRTWSGEVVLGEYVAGAWRIPGMLDYLQTGQPDITATMQANWDPNAKIHMLRWETGGILYEIIHADQTLDTLSAEMLVKIAESVK